MAAPGSNPCRIPNSIAYALGRLEAWGTISVLQLPPALGDIVLIYLIFGSLESLFGTLLRENRKPLIHEHPQPILMLRDGTIAASFIELEHVERILQERYILVPTDDDFPLLLDDIHQHGLRPIIGVLLVLSALHYPPSEDVRKYELGTLIRAICARVAWQAHSLSTAGTESNKVMARRQLLADGTITDACSGNIAKHTHAMTVAEYFEAHDVPLCPACQRRDSRRAMALLDEPNYGELSLKRVLRECGLCDSHGFLVTSKQGENGEEARQRLNKDTLIDFSYALALPTRAKESLQLHTRSGVGGTKEDGQMLMKFPVRSGEYALLIRYRCVGVGADLVQWTLLVTDEQERLRRHQAILCALRDTLISPDGALTATMLPHLTGLVGILVVNRGVGRAPLYSPLQEDFRERLHAMRHDSLQMSSFDTVDAFYHCMNELIGHSRPARLPRWNSLPSEGGENQRTEESR